LGARIGHRTPVAPTRPTLTFLLVSLERGVGEREWEGRGRNGPPGVDEGARLSPAAGGRESPWGMTSKAMSWLIRGRLARLAKAPIADK
jgi:hypothetical protein